MDGIYILDGKKHRRIAVTDYVVIPMELPRHYTEEEGEPIITLLYYPAGVYDKDCIVDNAAGVNSWWYTVVDDPISYARADHDTLHKYYNELKQKGII